MNRNSIAILREAIAQGLEMADLCERESHTRFPSERSERLKRRLDHARSVLREAMQAIDQAQVTSGERPIAGPLWETGCSCAVLGRMAPCSWCTSPDREEAQDAK